MCSTRCHGSPQATQRHLDRAELQLDQPQSLSRSEFHLTKPNCGLTQAIAEINFSRTWGTEIRGFVQTPPPRPILMYREETLQQ